MLELPKAETNLTLLKADLTQEGSFDEAIEGCHGVFHVATPMDFESKDPEVYIFTLFSKFCHYIDIDHNTMDIISQNEIIKPTIEGVLSIIRSCIKAKTVKKLVFTSSAGTVNVQEKQLGVYDETHWSDLDFIYSKKMTAWVRYIFVLKLKLIKKEVLNVSLFVTIKLLVCVWSLSG